MADVIRTPRAPLTERAAALLAGPFLLGQKALDLVFQQAKDSPGDPPPEPSLYPTLRPSITPPEHAIKRRG